jgi:16S rRNA pseudouridine516 synthase
VHIAGVKLDRLLAKHQSLGRKRARELLLDGAVVVDGEVVRHHNHEVTRFSKVCVGEETIQAGCERICMMLYKPEGIVSATKDAEHTTVIDLVDHPDKSSLHLAGRLDRSTTGLVILTNDGAWSKMLTAADRKIPKVYRVETRDPIAVDAVEKFRDGFYFHTEDITTLPAQLEILADRSARLTLHEGRYHQVKRMFHRVDNRVVALHRESVGSLTIPEDWQPGDWKLLTDEEVKQATMSAPAAPHRPE